MMMLLNQLLACGITEGITRSSQSDVWALTAKLLWFLICGTSWASKRSKDDDPPHSSVGMWHNRGHNPVLSIQSGFNSHAPYIQLGVAFHQISLRWIHCKCKRSHLFQPFDSKEQGGLLENRESIWFLHVCIFVQASNICEGSLNLSIVLNLILEWNFH